MFIESAMKYNEQTYAYDVKRMQNKFCIMSACAVFSSHSACTLSYHNTDSGLHTGFLTRPYGKCNMVLVYELSTQMLENGRVVAMTTRTTSPKRKGVRRDG